MLSRSAVGKLKAILIVDLIIVAAAAGAYIYLSNQGVITGAARPAEFTLTPLTISPESAYIGDTVMITLNVTNTGDVIGNDTMNLLINNQVKDTVNFTLANGESQELDFTDIENTPGNYTVKVSSISTDNSVTGNFTISDPPPESSKIVLSNFKSTPYESWPNDTVTITATAQNPSTDPDRLTIRVTVDGAVVQTTLLEMNASSTQEVSFNITAGDEGKHIVKLNSLQGSFTVVKSGYHTLTINRSGGGSKSLPFTLNGEDLGTPYTALLPVGTYSISAPTPYSVGTGVLEFTSWSTGQTSPSITFELKDRMILVCTYTVISGYASCPSLYIWNGTGYSYVTDVSNPGWLGYISHINSDGTIVFGGGNPYDYVKLDNSILKANNGYFDVTLSQQWDELYYLDSAQLLVVDHPAGTDVYTSMTNYLNKGSTGQIYTTNNGTLLSPIAATNEKGQNVLAQLLTKDGVYTPGVSGTESTAWNNITSNQLTLDLGNLSNASNIKLVITGMVDWGSADTYYKYIDLFKTAAAQGLVPNGTEIMPAPYLEVLAANGSWIRAPQDRQIPLPSDYNARTFTVDLSGLFPSDVTDYQVRFTNFWNVTYDYIGIDTSPQQNVSITTLNPSSATLSQWYETNSTSTGAFTRYGDVTELMQSTDDMFVIGRQGDQVNMLFSTANLTDPAPGMVRDYFLVVACWFKDPPGAWGYGFNFTVDPMPYLAMSGYPYTSTESYPYDAAHLAYIAQYNTRIIN
jgi:CARDB.